MGTLTAPEPGHDIPVPRHKTRWAVREEWLNWWSIMGDLEVRYSYYRWRWWARFNAWLLIAGPFFGAPRWPLKAQLLGRITLK